MTQALTLPSAYQLFTPHFAQNQQAYYAHMRENCGPVAPVEIAPGVFGHLVIGWWAALDLLRDTTTWTKDPTTWAQSMPQDSPVLGMLGPRPNPLFTDGPVQQRYRRVINDCFSLVEPHHLRDLVREVADGLIDQFAGTGKVDLISGFSRPLPSYVFNRLFGQPDADAPRLVAALAGLMEGEEGAARATAEFEQYMGRLIGAKTVLRGQDLTSWIMDHPEQLTQEEVLHNIVLAVGAGQEPTTNLIANTLALMLSDASYYTDVSNGALATEHAVARILRDRPPMANYGAHYARRDVTFHGTTIPAQTLVLVSFAAANGDPAGPGADQPSGAGAHLAWSAGPHACPVRRDALLIATTAIEQLIRRCTDLELAVSPDQLEARIGPFHLAYAHLPARFTPMKTTRKAGTPAWPGNPFTSSTRPAATSPQKPPTFANSATSSWSSCPAGYAPGPPPATGS
ncbi:cytochrome P450 [Streptacidiphilus sp. EB103A]|uniref:cytochrome P450 n=1 Tax=Streptacidiphilus sp. EB103A TaxID=3156275 RepID=UPI003512A1CF